MRWLWMLAGVAALAACSEGGGDRAPANRAEAAAAPAAAQAPRPANSGLTGQVSNLTSNVSGLNLRVTDYGTVIDLPADALFEFDKAELTPQATEQLQKAADVIRGGPPGAIRVIGHTDSKGDDAYNQRLSEARARTVADWFGEQVGVRQRAFEVSGLGETSPIAPNETADGRDDPAGRAKNRRVEVVVPKA